MRQWAWSVIAYVQQSLKTWCENAGHPDWYTMFCEKYLPSPDAPRFSQQALADRMDLSRYDVRVGLEEVVVQFKALLRSEMADQVGPDEDVDAAIRELQALLAP
jgi:hypothetical protein